MRGRLLVYARIGESLREAGLLVLVFGLLDELHRANPVEPVSAVWVAGVLLVSVGSVASGIAIDVLLASTLEVER